MPINRITPKFQWPKQLPVLTAEQQKARDEFMTLWHQELPNGYTGVERFNHTGAFMHVVKPGTRTLEIGSGLGGHIQFEDLSKQEYVANELRANMAEVIKQRYPKVKVLVGDVQQGLPVEDNSFDRAIAVHVLEHLPNLPKAVAEIRRVLKGDGVFEVVIPCEGGLVYTLARTISARRLFEKRFKMSYDFVVECEHVNLAEEVIFTLKEHFVIERRKFFPIPLPFQFCNLAIGLLCRPK